MLLDQRVARQDEIPPEEKCAVINVGNGGWVSRFRTVVCASLLAGLALPMGLQAGEAAGLSFSHGDWMLVCDNTRTCRAVGYQRDEDDAAVSVLFTREAGPGEPVRGKVKLGELDLADEVFEALTAGTDLSLVIDGQRVGKTPLDPDFLGADLTETQLQSLLVALRRDSRIEWVVGDYRWRLSDAGATAVLLKMDDVQGRIGTPTALVRKGSKPASTVLPPLAPPVVRAEPVEPSGPVTLPVDDEAALRAALLTSVEDEVDCSGLATPEEGGEPLEVVRLSDSRLMVSVTCWMAAYNGGAGVWVINDGKPYRPVLVTGSATAVDGGTISAMHKGRGIGDCYSIDEWVWDGEFFIHSVSYVTGQCRGLAAGGAWELTEIVTDVR